MKKLKLQLDDLRIDSFQTTAPEKPRGTVFGEQCTCYTQCTCPGNLTCGASCNGTCDAACNDTAAGPTCNVSCRNSCVAYDPCNQWSNGTCYDTCMCNRTHYC